MTVRSLRTLIADDHALIRRGVRELLESHPGWTICAEAATGQEAVERAQEFRPDLAVLDITMPELNGIDAARRIQKESPDTKILMLSMHYSEELLDELVKANIHGYVTKSDSSRDLVRAVETVMGGQSFFTHLATDQMLARGIARWSDSAKLKATDPRLTCRERQVMQLLTEGKSTKEVGIALKISSKTAETHRSNLMRKLAVHNVADLVRYAVRNRMIEQ